MKALCMYLQGAFLIHGRGHFSTYLCNKDSQ